MLDSRNSRAAMSLAAALWCDATLPALSAADTSPDQRPQAISEVRLEAPKEPESRESEEQNLGIGERTAAAAALIALAAFAMHRWGAARNKHGDRSRPGRKGF